ncbi:unnamed protein product [Pleuronectes platessa]|uniref:Uncharacterized protein n=1 Tax=Pleuronectes platessa TaxID=8262 RepID=A0A9N7UJN0_PLEPL|nr:unnamed protein product [Pleuronectes platessa]
MHRQQIYEKDSWVSSVSSDEEGPRHRALVFPCEWAESWFESWGGGVWTCGAGGVLKTFVPQSVSADPTRLLLDPEPQPTRPGSSWNQNLSRPDPAPPGSRTSASCPQAEATELHEPPAPVRGQTHKGRGLADRLTLEWLRLYLLHADPGSAPGCSLRESARWLEDSSRVTWSLEDIVPLTSVQQLKRDTGLSSGGGGDQTSVSRSVNTGHVSDWTSRGTIVLLLEVSNWFHCCQVDNPQNCLQLGKQIPT